MKTFKQLQAEHKKWAFNNFGGQETEDYCLGLIEEVGKLAHVILKRKQGIRNNENHNENIKDAIADIVIYLAGFCNCKNIDLQTCYNASFGLGRGYTNHFRSILWSVNSLCNPLNNSKDETYILNLFHCLKSLCKQEDIDFEETVLNTWKNVVSKRNWKDNSISGGKDEMENDLCKGCFNYEIFPNCDPKISIDSCNEYVKKETKEEKCKKYFNSFSGKIFFNGITLSNAIFKTIPTDRILEISSDRKIKNVIVNQAKDMLFEKAIHICDNCISRTSMCHGGDVFLNSNGKRKITYCKGYYKEPKKQYYDFKKFDEYVKAFPGLEMLKKDLASLDVKNSCFKIINKKCGNCIHTYPLCKNVPFIMGNSEIIKCNGYSENITGEPI